MCDIYGVAQKFDEHGSTCFLGILREHSGKEFRISSSVIETCTIDCRVLVIFFPCLFHITGVAQKFDEHVSTCFLGILREYSGKEFRISSSVIETCTIDCRVLIIFFPCLPHYWCYTEI